MDHPKCNRAVPLLLNARNYYIWSQKTRMILTREKLWQVVRNAPPTVKTQKWIDNNEQALACIGLLVEDKYLVDIRDHTEAHSAWEHLSHLYGQHNMQTRMLLHKTLFTSKYQPGTDISEHLVGIMDIASRLRDLGHPLDEPLLCSAILCSLPTEFSTLITTIESNSDQSLSTDIVRAKITEEANRQKLLREERPKPTVAFITETQPVPKVRATTIECYYCHKRGHLKRDCRMRKAHESHEGLTDATRYNSFQRTFSPPTQPSTSNEEEDPNPHRAYHIKTSSPRVMTMKKPSRKPTPLEWILDTGASEHICGNLNLIRNIKVSETLPIFQTADGKSNKAEGVGTCTITLTGEGSRKHHLELFPVYYLPQITDNLISIRKLDQMKYTTTFMNGEATISLDNETWVLGRALHGLYRSTFDPAEEVHICRHVLHDQMGHPNLVDLRKTMESSQNASHPELTRQEDHRCKICSQTKLTDAPYRSRELPNSTRAFEMLHSDLCGPIRPPTLGGNSYILTIKDDYSKYCVVRLLKQKNETTSHIKQFIEEYSTKLERLPTKYRTDGGGEFRNAELQNYFKQKGIQHQTTVPHTPQENGTSERHNRTLLDSTRAILKSGKLPKYMWGEITKTSSYLQNLTIRKQQEKTPFEAWTGDKPTYQHLRPIGTPCVYLNTSPTRGKLDDRGIEGILVGYGPSRHIYRVWDPKRNTVQISRRVVFFDRPCSLCVTPDDITETSHPDQTDYESLDPPTGTPQIRRSKRATLGHTPKRLTYDSQHSQTFQLPDWYSHNNVKEREETDSPDNRTYGGVLEI